MRDALQLLPLPDVSILLTERGGRTDLRPIDLRRAGHMGSVPGLSPRELLRARRARRLVEWFGSRLNPSEPERVGALDDRSVSEFCDLYLGKTLYRNVYAPLLESHFGCNPEELAKWDDGRRQNRSATGLPLPPEGDSKVIAPQTPLLRVSVGRRRRPSGNRNPPCGHTCGEPL